jgi:competence protein ComEC
VTLCFRLIAFILVVCFVGPPAWGGTLLIDVLDVGQGDAILIRSDEKAVLIDAGDRGANTEVQLKALGVKRLDLVVATHPHADHIGRMKQVLSNFDIGLYIDNGMQHTTMTYKDLMETVASRKITTRTAVTGMALKMGDEATFTVLHPDETLLRNTRSDLNSNSVVLLLQHGENKMLFTGDAEEPTEHALVSKDTGDVDLLKVAHHGSSHSSGDSFLRATTPEIAIISAGRDNRYGHPSEKALQRLANVGAIVYRTDLSQHVRVISDGNNLEVLEGKLDELIGVEIATSTAPPPPPVDTSLKPPPPDLPTRPAPTSTTSALQDAPSLEQLIAISKENRIREREERKAQRLAHKQAKKTDKAMIRDAKRGLSTPRE